MSLTNRLRSAASALSFAHLAGVKGVGPSKARARADDDADDGNAGSNDQNDDGNGQSKKSKKAKKADDDGGYQYADDDDPQADDGDADADDDGDADDQGDNEDDDEDGGDRDDDEAEMRGNSPVAKARRRERARCAAIFSSRHAAKNVAFAAHLAFNTTMTRRQALASLKDAPAPAAADPLARTRRNPSLGAAGGSRSGPSRAVAHDRMVGFMRGARDGNSK
jgi:hypothetical protein